MPRGDGSGPNGMGPMTGRAAGFCAGFNSPGFANPYGGRGGGFRGRGGGRGMGGWYRGGGMSPYYAPPAAPPAGEESAILKQQARYLEQELKGIRTRLEEIEKEKDK